MKPETKWTTTCEHCGGSLEFAASDAGKQADCCYCSQETRLTRNLTTPNLPKWKRKNWFKPIFFPIFWLVSLALVTIVVWGALIGGENLLVILLVIAIAVALILFAVGVPFLLEKVNLKCRELEVSNKTFATFSTFSKIAVLIVGFGIVFGGGGFVIFLIIPDIVKSNSPFVDSSPIVASQVSPSWWDGSVSPVKHWLKANANDPSSLQYVHWNSSKLGNGDVDVVVQYRAKNGFGALTLHRGDFVLSPDGTILRANPDMDAP